MAALAYAKSTTSVFWPRFFLGFVFVVAVLNPAPVQALLSNIYSKLYHSSLYQLSSFETIETVFFYALIELPFTYKFGHSPRLRIDQRADHVHATSRGRLPKMRRPSQRMGEILLYIAPLLTMDFTMIKKYSGVSVSSIRASGNYAPLSDFHQTSAINGTLTASDRISSSFLLPTVHNFTLSSPLQTRRALPPLPPTSRRVVLELVSAFIIYDALFFVLHLSLHRLPMLRSLHLAHHSHSEIHPQVTNRLSVPERLSLVLLANFSLNIIGSHVLTRTAFVPVFVYLLVEIHSGMDLPWGHEKIMPRGWGLGAKEHAAHHRNGEKGEGGYAPFFAWWDGMLDRLEGRVKAKT